MSITQIFNTTGEAPYPKILPTLDLNFANSKTIDPRIAFTRGSGGTYVDADGLIKYAGINEARFDHDPSTGESLGLLMEEARTNGETQSTTLSNYTANAVSITSQTVTAPDGSLTAKLITEDTSTGNHSIGRFYDNNYTDLAFSFFVKANGRTRIHLNLEAGDTGTPQFTFDLSAGTATGGGTIQAFTNGWYRVAGTISFRTSVAILLADNSNNRSYTGDGTSGVYIWGIQFEKSAGNTFPTSYIPASGSVVTRSADVASITGTNFSSWYNQSEGTAYFHSKFQDSIDATPSIVFGGYWWATNPNNWRTSSNGSMMNTAASRTTSTKHAFGLQSNNHAVSINGATAVVAATNNSQSPSGSTFSLNDNAQGVFLCGTIARLTYYPTRLPDATLKKITQ